MRTLLLVSCGILLFASHLQAYQAPYALHGNSELTASATWSHYAWPRWEVHDDDYSDYNGWWSSGSHYLLLSFDNGSQIIDKVQIANGEGGTIDFTKEFEIYYTTDPTPSLAGSTFFAMSGLSFINAVDGQITGNHVLMNTNSQEEILISFDAVEATAFRLYQISGFDGTNAVINEITIDTATIPEPSTIILILGGAIALITRLRYQI